MPAQRRNRGANKRASNARDGTFSPVLVLVLV
jgi:hypothetical protein